MLGDDGYCSEKSIIMNGEFPYIPNEHLHGNNLWSKIAILIDFDMYLVVLWRYAVLE